MSERMVFVVYRDLGYEGCSRPLRVFETEALANLYIKGSEWYGDQTKCIALYVEELADFADSPPQPNPIKQEKD